MVMDFDSGVFNVDDYRLYFRKWSIVFDEVVRTVSLKRCHKLVYFFGPPRP